MGRHKPNLLFYKPKVIRIASGKSLLQYIFYCSLFVVALCLEVLMECPDYRKVRMTSMTSTIVSLLLLAYVGMRDPGYERGQMTVREFRKAEVGRRLQCRICQLPKSGGRKLTHCETCGICCAERTHHCNFTGNCISRSTLLSFRLLLISTSLSILLALAHACVYFVGSRKS